MPTNRERVLELLWDSVEALNALQPPDHQLVKDPETRLVGPDAGIDSLALVQLISELETRIEDAAGVTIALADERAMSQSRSPFRTLGTLADYAATLLDEAAKGG